MMIFGVRFKKLRIEKKYTQQKLIDEFNTAYHYNLGKSAVSQYENGKRIPEIQVLMDFADFFGVSIDYLMGKTHVKDVPLVSETRASYDSNLNSDFVDLEELIDNIYETLEDDTKHIHIQNKKIDKKKLENIRFVLKLLSEYVKGMNL